MSCYSPIFAKNIMYGVPGAKALLRFRDRISGLPIQRDWSNALDPSIVSLPCGKCIGCRLDYSRMWADRMLLESQYHKFAYFVTLTYDDEHLPQKNLIVDDDGVVQGESLRHPLCKSHAQDFLKAYRERLRRQDKNNIVRFYTCGEYGSKSGRPHLHSILFQDYELEIKFWKRGGKSGKLYKCELIDDVWKKGLCCVSPANWSTMAYVARYVTKKLDSAVADYDKLGYPPEFSLCSRKPGLARQFFEDNKDKIFATDEIIISTPEGAHRSIPPRYFMRLLQESDPDLYNEVISQRQKRGLENTKKIQELTDLSYYDMLQSKRLNTLARTKSLRRNEV